MYNEQPDPERMDMNELVDIMMRLTKQYLASKADPLTTAEELQQRRQALKAIHMALGIKGDQHDE